MKSFYKLLLCTGMFISCCAFTTNNNNNNEKVIDVRLPYATFTDWLEYEVFTRDEQEISLAITHESGRVVYQEKRTLYGEAYLELDATEFPKGMYEIKATCKGMNAQMKIEKV